MERLESILLIFTIKQTYRIFKYSSIMVLKKSLGLIKNMTKQGFFLSKEIAKKQ